LTFWGVCTQWLGISVFWVKDSCVEECEKFRLILYIFLVKSSLYAAVAGSTLTYVFMDLVYQVLHYLGLSPHDLGTCIKTRD
jgi:hypothetical protein